MGERGRKRQLKLEDEYWRLILAGVGTVEACRQGGDLPQDRSASRVTLRAVRSGGDSALEQQPNGQWR